jgi:hypothetical protein
VPVAYQLIEVEVAEHQLDANPLQGRVVGAAWQDCPLSAVRLFDSSFAVGFVLACLVPAMEVVLVRRWYQILVMVIEGSFLQLCRGVQTCEVTHADLRCMC